MPDITIKIKKANGEFTIPGLVTLRQAREWLGYSSDDSVYRAVKLGKLRCAYVCPDHTSRRMLLFKKDVLALKKTREATVKKNLKKLENGK